MNDDADEVDVKHIKYEVILILVIFVISILLHMINLNLSAYNFEQIKNCLVFGNKNYNMFYISHADVFSLSLSEVFVILQKLFTSLISGIN